MLVIIKKLLKKPYYKATQNKKFEIPTYGVNPEEAHHNLKKQNFLLTFSQLVNWMVVEELFSSVPELFAYDVVQNYK